MSIPNDYHVPHFTTCCHLLMVEDYLKSIRQLIRHGGDQMIIKCQCGKEVLNIPDYETVKRYNKRTHKMETQKVFTDVKKYIEHRIGNGKFGVWRIWQTETQYKLFIMHTECYEATWKEFCLSSKSIEDFFAGQSYL